MAEFPRLAQVDRTRFSRQAADLWRVKQLLQQRMLKRLPPHIAQALWTGLDYAAALGDLAAAPWPDVDDAALACDEIELMLQVGGKLRGAIRVAADADRDTIEAAALAAPEVERYAAGKPPKKVVVVPGRLVNVVV